MQQIIATAAGECAAGADGVITNSTPQGVVAGVIGDQVVAVAAIDDVVAAGAI